MKYYKVVCRLKNGVRKSAGDIPDPLKLTYHIGKERRSPIAGGKLFVFKDLAVAKRFQEDTRVYCSNVKYRGLPCELWEVEVTNPQPVNLLPALWLKSWTSPLSTKAMLSVLADFWAGRLVDFLTSRPYGGVHSVDSLTLVTSLK